MDLIIYLYDVADDFVLRCWPGVNLSNDYNTTDYNFANENEDNGVRNETSDDNSGRLKIN